jgi:hypothetical protein
MLKKGTIVVLKRYEDDKFNSEGIVVGYDKTTNRYRVSNYNPPYIGNVDDYFSPKEIIPKNVTVDDPRLLPKVQ